MMKNFNKDVDNKVSMSSVLVIIVAALFVCLAYFLQTLPASTANYFEQTLNIDTAQFVEISTIFFVVYGLLQIPNGMFIDRYGIKILFPFGIFITLLGIILYWLASSIFLLSLSRFLEGIGTSMAYVVVIFIASKYFPAKIFPLLMGLIETIAIVGDITATNLFGNYIDSFGWDIANITVIVFCFILFICACSYAVFHKKIVHTPVKKTLRAVLKEFLSLFKNRAFICVLIYAFFTWFSIQTLAGFWGRDYFMIMHHYSDIESLHLMGVYWIGLLVSSPLIGFLVSKIGYHRLIIIILATIGLIAQSVMCIPILFNYQALIVIAISTGISASGIVIAFSIASDILAPQLKGTGIALLNTAIIFGGVAGQQIFKYIILSFNIRHYIHISVNGSFYTALLTFPISTLIALIAIILIVKKTKKTIK